MIDPAVLAGHRDHRVVLDVQLLLVADPVLALEDDVGLGEAGVEVAARRPRTAAKTWSLASGSKTGGRASVTSLIRPLSRRRVSRSGGGEQRHGLGDVADLAADRDEHGLVVLDRADDVLAGDVRGGRDDDLRPVDVGVGLDREELRPRLGGADRRAVPGAGEDEVVGVLRGAGELGRALAPEREARGAARDALPGVDDEGALDDVGAGREGAGGHPRSRLLLGVLGCALAEPIIAQAAIGPAVPGARRCRT